MLDFLDLFKQWTVYLAAGVEAAASLVIGLAVLQATVRFVVFFLGHDRGGGSDANHEAKEDIRLHLGRWLALALEFELAADILRTAVAPTWEEIGQLAAIIVIRTVLNFFLQREIDKAAERRGVTAQGTAPDSALVPTPVDRGDRQRVNTT